MLHFPHLCVHSPEDSPIRLTSKFSPGWWNHYIPPEKLLWCPLLVWVLQPHSIIMYHICYEEGAVVWELPRVQYFGVETLSGFLTVKSSPHCLIMKTYCRFFGTNAFKVPCWVRASGPSGAVGPRLGRQPEDTNPGQMRLPHPNVGRVKASWFKLVQRVCLPSRELTYPPKMAYMAFLRWCSFSPGGIC